MIDKILKLRNKKGFTLVELIIIIAIIAVLALVSVPILGDYLTKAKISSANASAKSYFTVMNAYMTDMAISSEGRNDGASMAYIIVTVDSDGTHSVDFSESEYNNWKKYSSKSELINNLENLFNESITGVSESSVLLVLNKNRCITTLFSPNVMNLGTLGTSWGDDATIDKPSSEYLTESGAIKKDIFGDTDNILEADGSVLGYFS